MSLHPSQIFLLTLTTLLMIIVIVLYQQKKINIRSLIFWLLVWTVGALIILFPGTTFEVANYLGIARGSDLVIYLSIIVIFYLLFRAVVRFERTDRDITTIVRRLALLEMEKSDK